MAIVGSVNTRSILSVILRKNFRATNRLISTSDKKKDSSEPCPPPEAIYRKVPDFSKPLENKNWVSFGFSKNRYQDKFSAHLFSFCVFTVTFGGIAFILIYSPDKKRLDWARREAYIRLYERESLGLDPIDLNFIDPEKIILPPDNEIGENDIII